MERFSGKVEIINHFDNLINKIDVDIDSSLEKYNDEQILSEIITSSKRTRMNFRNSYDFIVMSFFNEKFDSSKPNRTNLPWTESTKVVDYLTQVRMRTIEELRNAQDETLEHYKLNSAAFKSQQTNEKIKEELRSQLFAEKFYFQVNITQSKRKCWPFNLFTFVTDFYMSQSHIDSLEKLINDDEKEPFGRDSVFDDKIVLIGLLFKYFTDNLLNFPNHVIRVNKHDVLNIQSIYFRHDYSEVNLTSSSTIDLSKLVELHIRISHKIDAYSRESVVFNLEGLSSLKTLYLRAKTGKVDFSIKNLASLTLLTLFISGGRIDENIVTRLVNQFPHIQELCLVGNLYYFNLDNLFNLRMLSLSGTIDDKFNFELFKNLCKQLEDIKICLRNIDVNIFFKLFDGFHFPYLVDFTVKYFNIDILTSEFFNRFSTLNNLCISEGKIIYIESNSFSNLEQLTSLNLSRNQIQIIDNYLFSSLKNLQKLDLSDNDFFISDRYMFGLRESLEVNI